MMRKCVKIMMGLLVIVVTLIITENKAYATAYFGECGIDSASDSVEYVLNTDTGELTIYANASGDCYMRDFDLNTASEWLAHKNDIVSVTITGRVMNIGACAFRNCINLVSVSIPNAVINDIGDYAFYNCKHLLNFKSTQGKNEK